MNHKQMEGKIGEDVATMYLVKQGYTIICRNFRCMQGEIDIIAKDNDYIVFIEVKTRVNIDYGEAKEAVGKDKQKHIYEAAEYYLYKKREEETYVRIDVIEVYIYNRKGTNKSYKASSRIKQKTIDEFCKKVYYIFIE